MKRKGYWPDGSPYLIGAKLNCPWETGMCETTLYLKEVRKEKEREGPCDEKWCVWVGWKTQSEIAKCIERLCVGGDQQIRAGEGWRAQLSWQSGCLAHMMPWVKSLANMHRLSLVTHTCNPSPGEKEARLGKFKVILSYLVSSRLFWAAWDPWLQASRKLADHISEAHRKHSKHKVGQAYKFSKPTHNFVFNLLCQVAFISSSAGQMKISRVWERDCRSSKADPSTGHSATRAASMKEVDNKRF